MKPSSKITLSGKFTRCRGSIVIAKNNAIIILCLLFVGFRYAFTDSDDQPYIRLTNINAQLLASFKVLEGHARHGLQDADMHHLPQYDLVIKPASPRLLTHSPCADQSAYQTQTRKSHRMLDDILRPYPGRPFKSRCRIDTGDVKIVSGHGKRFWKPCGSGTRTTLMNLTP